MARNLDDARFCVACGEAFSGSQDVPDLPHLSCPSCEGWMHAREAAGQLVQECERCLGLWAPEGTFEALVDRAAAVGRARDATGAGIAPRVAGGNPASASVA